MMSFYSPSKLLICEGIIRLQSCLTQNCNAVSLTCQFTQLVPVFGVKIYHPRALSCPSVSGSDVSHQEKLSCRFLPLIYFPLILREVILQEKQSCCLISSLDFFLKSVRRQCCNNTVSGCLQKLPALCRQVLSEQTPHQALDLGKEVKQKRRRTLCLHALEHTTRRKE